MVIINADRTGEGATPIQSPSRSGRLPRETEASSFPWSRTKGQMTLLVPGGLRQAATWRDGESTAP